MIIYLILLFIVVFSSHFAERCKSTIESRFFLFIIFVSMVLFAGLRNNTVGTDTGSYISYFNKIQTFFDVISFGEKNREYGFWMLTWLVHFISDQYAVFLITIAMIVVGCYQWAIVRYSSNWTTSFFVFISMGFFTFFFNGARQGIACAIYALALGPLLERNFLKYVGYVLLAFLFHTTAIIMLPVYFIFDTTNTIKKNLLILLIGLAVAAMFQRIVELSAQVDEGYVSYGNTGVGGGYFMIGLTVVLGLFFLIFKKHVHTDQERYNLFLNIFMFGVMISLVTVLLSVNPSGFLRFSMYFNFSAVFLWPLVFKNLVNRSKKFLISYLFLTCYLCLFFLTTERFSNLIPYTFNPSISSLLPFGG